MREGSSCGLNGVELESTKDVGSKERDKKTKFIGTCEGAATQLEHYACAAEVLVCTICQAFLRHQKQE